MVKLVLKLVAAAFWWLVGWVVLFEINMAYFQNPHYLILTLSAWSVVPTCCSVVVIRDALRRRNHKNGFH